MADNPEDDFLASSAPVPTPRPAAPDGEYAYGIPDVQEMGIGTQFFNMFVPYRSRVVEPSKTEYIPLEELGMDAIKGEVMRKFTPGQYAEPEFGFSYMPAVQGIASFFSDPVESAKAAGQAIMELPKQQMLGAEAMMQGYDFAYDPETGQEYRYDPTLVPATTAAGTAISIAREGPGGQVLGIMGGRFAKDGQGKYETAVELYKEGKSDQEIFDVSKSYLDVDVLGTSRNYEDAFRFEMPTANSKLNEKEVFDGRMEGFRSVEVDDEYGSFSVNDAPYARLEQILDFPELYEQYPEIKDLRVARINSFGGAFYDPEKNFIGVADQLDNQKFQSALLHEVQHWVQHKEGFPTGGNARTIAEQLAYRMDAEDPEMLKGPARDLYQSLYGETEARTVQRRFLDPEEAKLTPIVSRRKEAPDTDISLDMVDAIDRGEEALIDALEYGDISYSDIYPETFSGGSGQPLKKGSVGFYPSEKIQRDPDTIYYKGMPIEESSAVNVDTFISGLGGETPFPAQPNRILFPDLKFSDVTLRESNIEPGAVDIELLRAGAKGEGLGSQTLKRITDRADETGTTLTLYPEPYGDGGLDIDELISFYQRNGFEFKYPDPDNPDPILDMVRYPRPTAQSSTLYRSEAQSYESPNEGAVFYTPDKSYAELYASEDRVLRETSLPANVFDIREPGNSEAVLNWVDQKISNLEDISGVSVDIRDVYAGIEQGGPQGASRALAAYNIILAKQADRSIIPGQAEKMFMQDFGVDAMTIKEGGRDLDEYSVAFKDAPVNKAEGGVISLADVARNMNRGPRGVGSLAPIARNMYRTMVS